MNAIDVIKTELACVQRDCCRVENQCAKCDLVLPVEEIISAYRKCINLLLGHEELKKENAELKEKYVQNICDCDICDTYCNSQLIKAKEIIRDFLSVAVDYIDKEDKNYSFIAEAEQFLNYEVEK